MKEWNDCHYEPELIASTERFWSALSIKQIFWRELTHATCLNLLDFVEAGSCVEKECNLQSKPKVGNCVKFFERKKISLVIQYFGGYEREFNYLRKLRTKASSVLRKIYYLRSCLIDNTIDSLFFFQQFLLQHERVRTQLMIWAYFLSHSLPLSSHVAS